MKYLTPTVIASRLDIDRRDVYRILKDLPQLRIGRRIRVAEADFDAYLQRNTVRPWGPSISDARAATTGATGPTPTAIDTSAPSARRMRRSRVNDSAPPSWVRPLKRSAASSG